MDGSAKFTGVNAADADFFSRANLFNGTCVQ